MVRFDSIDSVTITTHTTNAYTLTKDQKKRIRTKKHYKEQDETTKVMRQSVS